jgi:hypothetical protein
VKLLPWAYFAVLVAGAVYAWRLRDGKVASTDQDLKKLRELRHLGLQLETPQEVTFSLTLWTESSARRLASELERLGFRTIAERYSVDGDWTCLAVREIPVTLETLHNFRRHLEALAQAEGGAYDGWELGFEPSDSEA